MKTGIELIAEERQRQIEKEGWTPEHDAEHVHEEIAFAAACYAMPSNALEYKPEGFFGNCLCKGVIYRERYRQSSKKSRNI